MYFFIFASCEPLKSLHVSNLYPSPTIALYYRSLIKMRYLLINNQTNILYIRVCRKTLFSSDQFETLGELSLGMDY